MKRAMILVMTLVTLCGLTANVLAANSPREDSSMFLVWAFLGMCSLIVVVQLLPAMFMVVGMIKGLLQGSKQRQVELDASRKD